MSTATDLIADPELQQTEWDLDPLVDGEGADGANRMLDEAVARASAFNETYAGKVAELDGEGLRAAMQELAEIEELVGRAGSYASLWFSTDTAEPERGGAATARPGARDGDPDEAAVLGARVGGARR